jgi:tetratricopeptide (TPR) repeat protein/serine/threonine protein kinase
MSEPSLPEESIFAQALEMESSVERAAFLDQACANNPALRAEVEALLRANDKSGDLLDLPEKPGVTTDLPTSEAPGTVIGPYKLLEQIGEGGMGTVWMAEQTEPIQRRVALKVIKEGMDSKQVLARFEAERQALALMDHPNIAKVLDANRTPSGRPYFVMELVKGKSITTYCDEKRLGVRERLELFGAVCGAVQHAHQKGIIHRDIKPSNVLVAPYDGKPVVKVIDFGVAKATGQRLTDKTLFTGFGALVGTPEYMSPEQAEVNNQDIDTRSDIYALGVLLYELLTGSTPLTRKRLKEAALLEVLRAIREEEPPKPSTRLSESKDSLPSISAQRQTEPAKLTKLVRGELDWIVMKALEKDRIRRYETANGFAMDIQRFLADEPVQACPPSVGYRLRKFVRRNKVALTATFLVVLSLLLGTAFSVWQAVQATEAKELADDRLASERAANAALNAAREEKDEQRLRTNRELGDALADIGRLQEKVRLSRFSDTDSANQLRTTLGRAGTLATSELADPVLVGRVKALQGEMNQLEKNRRMVALLEKIRLDRSFTFFHVIPDSNEVGDTPGAYEAAFRDYGLPLSDFLNSKPPAERYKEAADRIRESAIRDWLVVALDDWATVLKFNNRNPEERNRLLALAQRVEENNPWRRRYFDARIRNDEAALAALAREPETLTQPLAIIAMVAKSANFTTQERKSGDIFVDVTHDLLLQAQWQHPDSLWLNFELAQRSFGDGVAFLRAALAVRPQSAGLHSALAYQLGSLSRHNEAAGVLRQAIRLNPDNPNFHVQLGWILWEKDDPDVDGAIAEYRKAIEIDPKYALAHAIDPKYAYAHAHAYLAVALRSKGDLAGAAAADRKAAVDPQLAWGAYAGVKNQIASRRMRLSNALQRYGQSDAQRAKWAEQLKKLDLEAEAALRRMIEFKPDDWQTHSQLAENLWGKPVPDWDGAEAAYRKAIALDARAVKSFSHFLWSRGAVLLHKGDPVGTLVAYRESIRLDPDNASKHKALADVLLQQGKVDEALASYRSALERDPKWATIHVSLGNALRQKRKLDEALACYQKALELVPKYYFAHNSLGLFLWEERHDFDGAIAEFEKAIEDGAADGAAYVHLGRVLAQKDPGKLNESIGWFRVAIASRPNFAPAHYNLGWALYQQRKLDEAIACYRRAITVFPKATNSELATAHRYLGLALADRDKLDEAIDCFRKAIDLSPKWATPHYNLGNALRQKKKLDEALASFRKAIEVEPNNPSAHINLGGCLCDDKQDYDGAIAAFEKAIALDPKNAIAYANIGHALKKKGELEKAIIQYSRSIELNSRNSFAWYGRGSTYHALRRYDKARTDWETTLKLAPTSAIAYNDLAWLLATCPEEKVRDPREAVAHGKKAVELVPRSGFNWGTLGTAHYRAGEWKEAVVALNKSRELKPGWDAYAWLFLAMAHHRLGDDAEARKAYDQAIQWLESNKELLEKTRLQAEELRRFRSEAEEVLELKKK